MRFGGIDEDGLELEGGRRVTVDGRELYRKMSHAAGDNISRPMIRAEDEETEARLKTM